MTDDDVSGPDERRAHDLPEDLDVTQYQGPYLFPDTNRRRIAGTIYLALAALCAIAAAVSDGSDGLIAGAILLALIGGYHFAASWPLEVDQTEALTVASRTVGFPVGHASGQLGFRGLRSRPSWRILLYSADEPPSMRGLVELDGVDGSVQGEYTELNPEDWSQYGLDESAGQPPD